MYYIAKIENDKFYYVANMKKTPNEKSYTRYIEYAKPFIFKEQAKAEKCGNEIIIEY